MFVAVLLAHLMLLQGMSFGAAPARTAVPVVPVVLVVRALPERAAALQVRQLEPPGSPSPQLVVQRPVAVATAAAPPASPEPVAAAAAPAPTPTPAFVPMPLQPRIAPAPLRVNPTPQPSVQRLPATAPEPVPSDAAPPEARSEVPSEAPAPALLLAAAAPSPRARQPPAAPAPGAAEGSVPVYATRLPAPVLLRYELRRGAISGTGELRWRPAEGRYQMEMDGAVFGLNALSWASQGRLDAAGIAPERFVDRRRGRDAQAANFQRDKGLITYSGAPAVHALVPGAQDRLSFMLQLAAIVDAAPAKFGVGAKIEMFVSGARGDAEVWTFTVESADTLNVPAGRVADALHLRREPRMPYDTRAEVWLDAARSHLPVRVRLSSAERDEAIDFLLREVAAP